MGIMAAMTFVRFGLEPLVKLMRRLFVAPGSWEKSSEYYILREVLCFFHSGPQFSPSSLHVSISLLVDCADARNAYRAVQAPSCLHLHLVPPAVELLAALSL